KIFPTTQWLVAICDAFAGDHSGRARRPYSQSGSTTISGGGASAIRHHVEGLADAIEGVGGPGVTRTPGTQFRKLLLYPPELRGPTSAACRRFYQPAVRRPAAPTA